MAIAKGKTNTQKRKGIFELIFPKKIRESRCDECGRPYLEHPEREPTERFAKGNVELFLYEDRSGFRKEYKLRIGVWRPSQDNFSFCQLFSEVDFPFLKSVVTEAVEFVAGCEEVIQKDTAEKMSSRRS